MHALHLIAVEADSHEEAEEEVDTALRHYGDGDVWDYYVIGGGWKGIFGDENKYSLCFSEDPEAFRKSIESTRKWQDKDFKELVDKITGRQITETDVGDTIFGMAITDKKGAAERMSEFNRQTHELFLELQTFDRLPDENTTDSFQSGFGMVGYYLLRLGKILCGRYTFESHFFDAIEGDPRTHAVLERCESGDGDRQYLVAVDLHN